MALTGAQTFGVIVGAFLLLLLAIIILLKIYARLTCGVCTSKANLDNKTVLITGATSGIGKETARDIARRGARLILACRNTDEANRVRDELIKETGNSKIVVKKLDLSSMESVRAFAADVNKTEPRLHVLIHNAGVAYTFQKVVSKDGFDMTMATNHFGPFLLTHLLMNLMIRSKPARIVIVGSELYRFCCCTFNVNQINPVNFWLPVYLYYYSKYVNILFSGELARRLEGNGVTVNCLHPGLIDTGIWSKNVPFPLNLLMLPLTKGLFKSVTEGAQTTIHCAVSEEVEGVTGKYFLDCKPCGLSQGVQDAAIAKKMWDLTSQLVLKQEDPVI